MILKIRLICYGHGRLIVLLQRHMIIIFPHLLCSRLLGGEGGLFEIVYPKGNEWKYDYENHNMERNVSLWQRLFASSNNDSFNIKNSLSSFDNEGGRAIVKEYKLLRDKVNFDETISKKCIEDNNH